ncbi:MAG: NAD(P)/FAD-dependent oxidoreductase [Microthrixaceae bacterium]
MTTPEPSAIESAKERYEAERAKRLRSEGLAQYESLRDHDLDRDPWADPDFTRDPVVEDVQVVVLGGGWAGMLAGINLVKRGITNFRIIDKAADFGGTWYWNRYPGCMCDVESYIYLPLLEETGYMPTKKYASASEIFGYAQLLGRNYGMYDHALFQTEVESYAVWDDDAHRWHITTQRGDKIRTQFFVTAGGVMHKAKLPGIPGIRDFTGNAFHTTRWDYEYTGGGPTEPMDQLADKVVGIIGTGATAVQAVPKLAEAAKQVYVFQRTPSNVGERNQQATDPEWFPRCRRSRAGSRSASTTSRRHDHRQAARGRPRRRRVGPGPQGSTRSGSRRTMPSDAELERSTSSRCRRFRDRIDAVVEDQTTAEKLKPWYKVSCKRPCFHDDYLPSFNLPNVTLVDTDGHGVDRITARRADRGRPGVPRRHPDLRVGLRGHSRSTRTASASTRSAVAG